VPHKGPVRILFYGQLIPLHGIETILTAALSARGRAHRWHLIGTGQMRSILEAGLQGGDVSHITWETWVPYADLTSAIAETDICLGIFGASRKAASVVPNKVYQALTAGRSVITRISPAMAESFADNAGLVCVPHSDPDAILDAIDALSAAGFPTMEPEALTFSQPAEIASRLCQDVLLPVSTKMRPAC
jgi:glycosyltransferase involved in cell wall biosynthesis